MIAQWVIPIAHIFLSSINSHMKRQKIMDLGDYLPGGKHLPDWLLRPGERFLGFHAFNVAHAHIEDEWEAGSTENFFKLACKHLTLNYDLEGLENIPKEGPCVIVANHAHGMSDGLMFGDVAMKVREDIRIVVNEWLHCVRGMRPYQITVDVYGGEKAKRANMQGMKQMLQWLRDGHCILVFPSGSAATYSKKHKRVVEDPWQPNIATIIRKTGATVVPMNFSGHNGRLFQLVSVLAKSHRGSLLPREIKRDSRTRHTIRIGEPIQASTYAMLPDDAALSDFLRLNSMLLRYPKEQTESKKKDEKPRDMAPIDEPVASDILQAEIDALPAEAKLFEGKTTGLQVYEVYAHQAPRLLDEIGVQREITFRAVGEGSGTSKDLDEYDRHYIHLVMWDSRKHALAGAYRIGRTDEILAQKGVKGIYNSLFFDMDATFQQFISKGLEMGRAFITAAYQRHPASLDTLWMGIGSLLNKYKQYRYLYGTVSISQDFTELSRSLILSYLRQNEMIPELVPHIKAATPPTGFGLLAEDEALLPTGLQDMRLLNTLVTRMEPDGKGMPVLLRQYLRLGGKMVSFNVDKDFGNTLDCMVIVDLSSASERMMRRYCGTPS